MVHQELTLDSAVAEFGRSVAEKLSGEAAHGEPEDELRAPLERLLADLAMLAGREHVVLVGEASLAASDAAHYAVSFSNALVGFIEVKAPGTGSDPRRFRRRHDKDSGRSYRHCPT